ncbi:MAG: pyridoxal-dependent decarboxylase, exosortase A system-associated [Colwellia sp.]
MSLYQAIVNANIVNNQLVFAGKKAKEIANIAGQTPCYLYDRQLVTRRIDSVKKLLPKQVCLHYAVKANPLPALVTHIASQVDGLDVASHEELILALSSGIPAAKISLAGPGKCDKELVAAIVAGIVINIESEQELIRSCTLAKKLAKKAQVAFRINPEFIIQGAGMKMTGGAKPFGVDAEYFQTLFRLLDQNHCQFIGFHIFCGSQILSADILINIYRQTLELAVELSNSVGIIPRQINIGGGFGVPYFQHEVPLDITKVFQQLKQFIACLSPAFSNTEIHLELGRYLVAHAGIYLTQIVDKKISRGETFLVCDGGMHHHLANSGNFGQVIRKNYPVLLANQVVSEQQSKVNIVGPLCTPLDIIATNIDFPTADIGDYIAILVSGAYGATASPQLFLSRDKVKELLL